MNKNESASYVYNRDVFLPKNSNISLRDYFAAKALPITYQYWMTDYYHPDAVDADIRADDERGALIPIMEVMASTAYDIADAMLKAREE